MSSEANILFDRLLPETLEVLLTRVLGTRVPRQGPDGCFRISSCGRFSGRLAADLLAFARNQKHDGAFVVLQDDVERVLYFQSGTIVGADSNVLFERLGRVLLRAGTLDREGERQVTSCEEQRGLLMAASLLPKEAAQWGLEKRVWEVGTALYFMGSAHFLIVDGLPDLGDLPLVSVAPMDLAMEGLRRYDEWRNGKPSSEEKPTGPERRVQPAARAKAGAPPPQDVDDIMRLIGE